jgi:hypothetical protein
LCWIESRNPGFVEKMNAICAHEEFHRDPRGKERDIARDVCGKTWEQLWREWGEWLAGVEKEGAKRERSWRRIYMG